MFFRRIKILHACDVPYLERKPKRGASITIYRWRCKTCGQRWKTTWGNGHWESERVGIQRHWRQK